MDGLIQAARETLQFTCGIDEDFEHKLMVESEFIAEKYELGPSADGLIAILIRHPSATKEWLDSVDLMTEQYEMMECQRVSAL